MKNREEADLNNERSWLVRPAPVFERARMRGPECTSSEFKTTPSSPVTERQAAESTRRVNASGR
jgi:hypothetical protein